MCGCGCKWPEAYHVVEVVPSPPRPCRSSASLDTLKTMFAVDVGSGFILIIFRSNGALFIEGIGLSNSVNGDCR